MDSNSVHLFGQRHKLPAKTTTLRGKRNIDFLPITGLPAANDIAKAFRRLYSRKRSWFQHAGLLAQFALGEAVGFPKDAQERPVTEGDPMFAESHLQCPHQSSRCILDEMCEAIVRHGLLPVPEDDLRTRRNLAHVRPTSAPER